jgi:hypothetical protein
MNIKEKTFFILEVDKKNKNHRIYPRKIAQKWIDGKPAEGYDIEWAVEDIDLEYEFLKETLSCGVVAELFWGEGADSNKLYAKAKFKIEGPKAEEIYNNDKFNIDKLTIVPKGKGAVKNQTVQDDYELYGFNLILLEESSFIMEETAKAEA